jgi:hydroxymethylbilane synthase
MAERITEMLDTDICLPAIGQGAVGIECRIDDVELNSLLQALKDNDTEVCVAAERALNHRLEGGCQVPIAGHAILANEQLFMRGLVGRIDGSEIVSGEISGPRSDAEFMGVTLADDLLSRGAAAILKEVYAD